MIYFDVTKTGWARHRSGLTRVSSRLAEELGANAAPVRWDRGSFRPAHGGGALDLQRADWLLTAELFSEEERPGIGDYIRARPCRLAAIFHDNIPLRLPHVTWPQSVERHPGYVKLLAGFDRIWAVSAESRDDLLGFWQWQGVVPVPPVDLLALGADFNRQPRVTAVAREAVERPSLVCVGIIEPRKNQAFLLETCTGLWDEGLDFALHLVGRINPHFGKKIVKQIVALQKRCPNLQFHEAADDELLRRLYGQVRASVFPTLAEGCGLPLLESLWLGVPCVCSDLPVLRENAAGGCLPAAVNDRAAWRAALRAVLTDDAVHGRLVREAVARPLPTWAQAAAAISRELSV